MDDPPTFQLPVLPGLTVSTSDLEIPSQAAESSESSSRDARTGPDRSGTALALSLSPITLDTAMEEDPSTATVARSRVPHGLVAAASPSPSAHSFFPSVSRTVPRPPRLELPSLDTFPTSNSTDSLIDDFFATNPPAPLPRPLSGSFVSDSSSGLTPLSSTSPSPIDAQRDHDSSRYHPEREASWASSRADQATTGREGGGGTSKASEKRSRDDEAGGTKDHGTEQRLFACEPLAENRPSTSARPIGTTKGNSKALFIDKLYDILQDPGYRHLVVYGSDGKSFEVLDTVRFAREVLPLYFKHANFSSFVRQLNMWGWRKESKTGEWNFVHSIFERDRPDLLSTIRRADETNRKTNGLVSARRQTTRPSPKLKGAAPAHRSPPPRLSTSRESLRDLSRSERPRKRSFEVDTRTWQQRDPTPNSANPSNGPYHVFQPIGPSPTFEYARAPLIPQYEGPFPRADELAQSPSTPHVINAVFASDAPHLRPIAPPTFLENPRPAPPPLASYESSVPSLAPRSSVSESDGASGPATAVEAEATRRCHMAITLLEHLVHKLDVDSHRHEYQTFPFYVFDPRFLDPTVSLKQIIDDYDVQQAQGSAYPQAQDVGAEAFQRHSSIASSFDPSESRPQTGYYSHIPIDLTVPPARIPEPSVPEPSPMEDDPEPVPASTAPNAPSDPPSPSLGLGISFEGAPVPTHRVRKASIAPVLSGPRLGPSSFSLVDFDESRGGQPRADREVYHGPTGPSTRD
ncbi:hypothetical protein JCM10212_000550 [Sporobolomyces blumeae]